MKQENLNHLNKVVQIGTQMWTSENLSVSKYRNGDDIPQVQDAFEWEDLTTGAWCYSFSHGKERSHESNQCKLSLLFQRLRP